MKIGAQIAEAVRVHEPKIRKAELDGRVLELLGLVGIDRAKERMQQYPGQMSGGMRQRCVLAIALASNPRILFADEPTTALDVTIQSQILELFRNIQKKFKTATILVSHDLSVVAGVADGWRLCMRGRLWRSVQLKRSFISRNIRIHGHCCSRSRLCQKEKQNSLPYRECRRTWHIHRKEMRLRAGILTQLPEIMRKNRRCFG